MIYWKLIECLGILLFWAAFIWLGFIIHTAVGLMISGWFLYRLGRGDNKNLLY